MFWIIVGLIVVIGMALGGLSGARSFISIAALVVALLSSGCETMNETRPDPTPSTSGQSKAGNGDPCAVGLTGQERLARMEKLGTVRQTGATMYEVGNHRLLLDSSGGLISCR
jgi:hypothetical protein